MPPGKAGIKGSNVGITCMGERFEDRIGMRVPLA